MGRKGEGGGLGVGWWLVMDAYIAMYGDEKSQLSISYENLQCYLMGILQCYFNGNPS